MNIQNRYISIIHPSRGRAEQAFKTAEKWVNSAAYGVEYILSIDCDDPQLELYKSLFGASENTYNLLIDLNLSAIEAINWGAQKAKGDLLIVISDDFSCPENWDVLLLEELSGKSDFVVKTQDGIQPTLITLPIMDRVFYNRFGYIYHPDYKHMSCDVELTAVGLMLGRTINSNLLFEHLHYSTGKSPKDAINDKNDLTYEHGDMVLKEHLKNNFGIKNPLIQYNEIVWH